MKTSELRIGNLFLDSKTNLIVEINMINSLHIQTGVTRHQDKELYHLRFDELTPIPLTSEWMKDFGFETDSDYSDCFHNDIAIYAGDTFTYNASYFEHDNLIEIKYVHELQNLYYELTKEELILKSLN